MKPSLFVDEMGDGVPVVLLHSSGLSGRQFRRLAGELASRGFRTISPDLSGHGKSPPVIEPAPFSFHDDVGWLSELLAARGPAHLVGHSYGGFVALQAARNLPHAVRSLSLFEPVAFGVLDPSVHLEACGELAAVDRPWGPTDADRVAWLRAFVDYWGGAGAWDGQREEARAEFRRVGWVLREGVRTLGHDETKAAAYRVIGAPMTILGGERSTRAAHAVVAELGKSLENARVETISGAGHMGPLTHADAVNARVLDAITNAA